MSEKHKKPPQLAPQPFPIPLGTNTSHFGLNVLLRLWQQRNGTPTPAPPLPANAPPAPAYLDTPGDRLLYREFTDNRLQIEADAPKHVRAYARSTKTTATAIRKMLTSGDPYTGLARTGNFVPKEIRKRFAKGQQQFFQIARRKLDSMLDFTIRTVTDAQARYHDPAQFAALRSAIGTGDIGFARSDQLRAGTLWELLRQFPVPRKASLLDGALAVTSGAGAASSTIARLSLADEIDFLHAAKETNNTAELAQLIGRHPVALVQRATELMVPARVRKDTSTPKWLANEFPELQQAGQIEQGTFAAIREQFAAEHPILLDLFMDFRVVATQPVAQAKAYLYEMMQNRLEAARETQDEVADDPMLLLDLLPLISSVRLDLGIENGDNMASLIRDAIRDKQDHDASVTMAIAAIGMALAIASLGLGTGALASSLPGLTTMVTGGTLAVSGVEFMRELKRFQFRDAAHNASMTMVLTEAPDLVPVILAALGFIVDVADIGLVVKALRANLKGVETGEGVHRAMEKVFGELKKAGKVAEDVGQEQFTLSLYLRFLDSKMGQKLLNPKGLLAPGKTKSPFSILAVDTMELLARSGSDGRPVGRFFKSEAMGRKLLRMLARGDESALEMLGVTGKGKGGKVNPAEREWGLAQHLDEYFIVAGSANPTMSMGDVPWDFYNNQVKILGHTHPWRKFRGKFHGVSPVGPDQSMKMADIVRDETNVQNLLPSGADFHIVYESGAPHHTLFSPFRYDPKTGNVLNPDTAPHLPNIEFHWKKPHKKGTGDPSIHAYEAELNAFSAGKHIWKGQIDVQVLGPADNIKIRQ